MWGVSRRPPLLCWWTGTGRSSEKYHHVRLALDGAEAVSERIISPEEAETLRAAFAGSDPVYRKYCDEIIILLGTWPPRFQAVRPDGGPGF